MNEEMKKDQIEMSRLAWNLDGVDDTRNAPDNHRKCCASPCGPCCGIFLKYALGRSLQLCLYVLDIATDIGVAVGDYRNGDKIFAGITLGLVFTPGLLFALFAFTQVLYNNTGLLACIKAPFWILIFPLLPLWPVARDIHQIYHGVLAMFPANRQHHLDLLNKPSNAYLVKFLEAFAEAAPQILLRLCKITLRRQEMPFYEVEPLEYFQITFSLVSLSNKILSTYQKNISTAQIVNGDMEESERYKLPCSSQILAFVWWVSFLMARFQAMALFAGSFGWWILVVIGIHVALVFLFQTIAAGKDRIKRIFIYLFSAFVFIFAYLEFNMKARMKVAFWFPYTIYAILAFIENSVMLISWFFVQLNSMSPDLPVAEQEIRSMHRLYLIFFHYGTFFVSLIFMILTFCCAPKEAPKDDVPKENHTEATMVIAESSLSS